MTVGLHLHFYEKKNVPLLEQEKIYNFAWFILETLFGVNLNLKFFIFLFFFCLVRQSRVGFSNYTTSPDKNFSSQALESSQILWTYRIWKLKILFTVWQNFIQFSISSLCKTHFNWKLLSFYSAVWYVGDFGNTNFVFFVCNFTSFPA